MLTFELRDERLRRKLHDVQSRATSAAHVVLNECEREASELERDLANELVTIAPAVLDIFAKREPNGARVAIPQRNQPIEIFGKRQTSVGVEVDLVRGEPVVIRSAFGPRIARLNHGVYRRRTRQRLPIQNVKSVGILHLARSRIVLRASRDRLAQRINRSVRSHLEGAQ